MAKEIPPASIRLLNRALLPVLLLAASATVLLERVELRWLDAQMQFLSHRGGAVSPLPVVVVGIDEDSLQTFGVPLAMLHRQLGGFFEAMAKARPRAVGVDVVLPHVSYDRIQPGLDAALARGILALRPVAPLVLGMSANADGSLRPLHPLFANLAGPDGLAVVFVQKDADSVIRRFEVETGHPGATLPTLVGQIGRRLDLPVQDGLVPYFRGARVQPVPLHTVLAWHAAGEQARLAETFGGKVVFLGSLLAFDDQHRVPVALGTGDVGETTHGVFLHAAQMRSLMTDGFIAPVPMPWTVLVAVLLAMSLYLPPRRRTWWGAAALLGVLFPLSVLALSGGVALPAVTWAFALLTGIGGRAALAAWQTATERRRLRQAFDGFVSPGVLAEILDGRLTPQMAGERRDVCVLFSDIRNFTTLSERMTPERVTNLLNRYFERMVDVIHRHGGTLDKFIGDGIMVFFGAPGDCAAACDQAFRAAQEMLAEVEAFNQEQATSGGPCIAIGIGLHYGPALIGYIGAQSRHAYSAIGDTVNTASRLEGLTKEAGYPVVLSPDVCARLTQDAGVVALGEFALKGRAAMRVSGWKP